MLLGVECKCGITGCGKRSSLENLFLESASWEDIHSIESLFSRIQLTNLILES